MKIIRFSFALFFAFSLGLLAGSPSFAQQKEGQLTASQLPKKVLKAVQAKIPGAQILSIYTEQEGGEQRYEITAKSNDTLYALEITADGIVKEFSEEKPSFQKKEGKEEKGEAEENEEVEVEGGRLINFDSGQAGSMPTGWTAHVTGNGPNSQWKVQAMDDAPSTPNVFVQVSHPNVSFHFNVAVLEGSQYSDVELSVHFKALHGQIDQGGGLVWRLKDADNYYIARANPLENNFRVYKVVEGRRIQLQSARIPLKSGQWYVIRIENEGNRIECYLNGKKYLDIKDDTFKTGKTGLWTKADAVTAFDNFRVKKTG